MKKKILFFVPLPPPIHGASVINKSIKDNKKIKNNFKTFFFNSSQSKNLIDVGNFNLKKTFLFLNDCVELSKKIINIKPDIIYFNPSPRGIGFYRDILYIIILKFFKKKLVFHLHGRGFKKKFKKSYIWKKLLIKLFKDVNLICLSKKLTKDILLFNDKKKKVFILNNFSLIKKDKIKKKKLFTFIYLSNLVPDKGVLTFLNAISLLNKKKYKNFSGKIIGGSSNEPFLNKVKQKLYEVKNVEYLGKLYGHNKDKELNSSNVFILPTKFANEAFPLSILEAMAFGLPIITSNIGGISDIVDHNKNGFVIKKNNHKLYAKFMAIYLKNRKLVKIHGINAKTKHDKNYTPKIFENRFINILKEII